MGCHLDIQEKVIQELDEIFGDSDRPVTFQDTLEMKYLERCLMETLRLFPPVPIIARKINTDLKLGTSLGLFDSFRDFTSFSVTLFIRFEKR
jgi:cytochrome P450 family 4